jgi:hypothetical protein
MKNRSDGDKVYAYTYMDLIKSINKLIVYILAIGADLGFQSKVILTKNYD